MGIWTPESPLNVGDIRRVAEVLPDDAQLFVDGHPDRPVVGVIVSQQIPEDRLEVWEPGDDVVTGLELWLAGDDVFPMPQCRHPEKGETTRSVQYAVRFADGVIEDSGKTPAGLENARKEVARAAKNAESGRGTEKHPAKVLTRHVAVTVTHSEWEEVD